jgi:hypothetical protein
MVDVVEGGDAVEVEKDRYRAFLHASRTRMEIAILRLFLRHATKLARCNVIGLPSH